MKKRKKLLASAILVGAVCMLQVGQSSVAALDMASISVENIKNNIDNTSDEKYTPYYQDVSQWYDKDGNIQAPIILAEELWQSTPIFSERCELCAIPDEVLQNATTEELLQLVVDCKLNYLISLYGDVDMAMTRITECFNGIRELMSRDDCGQVVLDMYNKFEIPENSSFDEKLISGCADIQEFNERVDDILDNEVYVEQIQKDSKIKYTINVLEWLLTQESVVGQFDASEMYTVIETVSNKIKQKNDTEYADIIENYLIDKVVINDEALADNYVCFSSTKSSDSNGNKSVWIRTPSQRTLVIEYVSNPTTLSERASIDWLGEYKKYKGQCVFLLDNGTSKYNCYAYAWFTMLPGYHNYAKTCQLNDTQNLRDDSKIHTHSSPVTGSVLEFNGHAVYVEQLSYTYAPANVYNDILISEKMSGLGPLVKWPMKFTTYKNATFKCYHYK